MKMTRWHKVANVRAGVKWALTVIIVSTIAVCWAQVENTKHGALTIVQGDKERSPKSWWRSSVRWEGVEYGIDEGIEVLINVVREPDSRFGHWNAAAALTELSSLGGNLKGRPCLDELGERYGTFDVSERCAVLLCFRTSGDPRGIPLFMHVLDEEKNVKLRAWAASGLAAWNVRRGVAELVKLLDSQEEMPQPSQLFYVRDHALQTFRLMNIRKDWGFPDDKDLAEWPPDVIPAPDVAARQKAGPTVGKIKKWFAENEQRFPEWKLGDPLPEVEVDRKPSQEDSHGEDGTP